MVKEEIIKEKKTKDNKFIVFFKKYWWLLLLLLGGIIAAIVVGVRGSGGGDSGIIFDPNNLGMFVFTMIDEEDKGTIIPIMISGDNETNSVPASEWFKAGIINGITPNYDSDTNMFSVTLTPKAKAQIQSISFASSTNNDFISPNFGTSQNVKQFNYIILGELDTSETTNTVLNLFEFGKGVSSDLSKFTVVDSGPTSFDSMKIVIQDNLNFSKTKLN